MTDDREITAVGSMQAAFAEAREAWRELRTALALAIAPWLRPRPTDFAGAVHFEFPARPCTRYVPDGAYGGLCVNCAIPRRAHDPAGLP